MKQKASGASASIDTYFTCQYFPHRKRGSSQQNGPTCKGPAHDCTRGRSLLQARVCTLCSPGRSVTRGAGQAGSAATHCDRRIGYVLLLLHPTLWVRWHSGGKQPACVQPSGCRGVAWKGKMKWPDVSGLTVWLPAIRWWCFDDATISRSGRCLPRPCVAFRVYLHYVLDCMHTASSQGLQLASLRHLLGHLHHMFCLLFCCPEWYLIRCRSGFS